MFPCILSILVSGTGAGTVDNLSHTEYVLFNSVFNAGEHLKKIESDSQVDLEDRFVEAKTYLEMKRNQHSKVDAHGPLREWELKEYDDMTAKACDKLNSLAVAALEEFAISRIDNFPGSIRHIDRLIHASSDLMMSISAYETRRHAHHEFVHLLKVANKLKLRICQEWKTRLEKSIDADRFKWETLLNYIKNINPMWIKDVKANKALRKSVEAELRNLH